MNCRDGIPDASSRRETCQEYSTAMGNRLVTFSAYCIPYLYSSFYLPQTKFAKIMFLYLSVSHSVHRGGVSASVHAGIHPHEQTPPWANTPLGVDTPPGSKRPPPAQCMLGNTANKRAVRILLECIPVPFYLLRNHINIVINQWQIQEFPEEEVRHFPEERRAWTHYLAKGLLKTAWKWKKLDPFGSANVITMKIEQFLWLRTDWFHLWIAF